MNPVLAVPPHLIERYRTRAPRYTSYPTAPHFGPVSEEAVGTALAHNDGPLSLYVHVPFCRSLCTYCGCHVEIRHQREIGATYVDQLLAEADLWRSDLRPGRRLDQLSLGGGTPTFLLPTDMARLVEGLGERFGRSTSFEGAIEIDPRTVDAPYLGRLVELGFSRFSLGVQDFDPAVLASVNRDQPFELVRAVVRALEALGDYPVNFDLLYGLPHQTEASFESTLDRVMELRPSRIALFQYAHVPWMKPAQKLVERAGLPPSALKARLCARAAERLGEFGYVAVGMDHYALPGDRLLLAAAAGALQRNFMGYATGAGVDQIGLGVSAIGYFGGVYAQNLKDRDRWGVEVGARRRPIERGFVLSADDRRRREVILALFCNFRVDLEPGEWTDERERLAPLEADGLVVRHPGHLEVTPLGRNFIRNVCAVFDRYLEMDPAQRRYSATA